MQWVRFPRNGFCPHVYIRRQNPIISKPPPYGSVDLKANVPSIILDVAPGHFHKSRAASTAARTTLLHTNLDTQKPVGTTDIRVSLHRRLLGSCAEIFAPRNRWRVQQKLILLLFFPRELRAFHWECDPGRFLAKSVFSFPKCLGEVP